MTDLLVAGGGPVGLAVAIEAAVAGLTVVVADPRVGDGDKACGEGLMPSALAALGRLGVDPAGRTFLGIGYVRGPYRAEARFPGAAGRGVRRTVLVDALRRRADEVGVVRVAARVQGVVQDGDGVRAGGLRARYLAVADGLHSPLRRELGLNVPDDGPARYGLRRHLAVPPWSDLVEVHWGTDAEAYVTPVADDMVGVAVLGPGGAPYDAWLTRFPALRERLAGAAPVSRVRGAGPMRRRVTARVHGRALLVGDAAGYVDALTGEGLAVGFAAAHELVACVLAERPAEYDAAWRRVTRRSRVVTEGLLWASRRPRLRAAVVPAAARLPRAFAALVAQLA